MRRRVFLGAAIAIVLSVLYAVPAVQLRAEHPFLDEWLGYMHKHIHNPDRKTFLVGHSLGCIAILRYLESLNEQRIGGAVNLPPHAVADHSARSSPQRNRRYERRPIPRAAHRGDGPQCGRHAHAPQYYLPAAKQIRLALPLIRGELWAQDRRSTGRSFAVANVLIQQRAG